MAEAMVLVEPTRSSSSPWISCCWRYSSSAVILAAVVWWVALGGASRWRGIRLWVTTADVWVCDESVPSDWSSSS